MASRALCASNVRNPASHSQAHASVHMTGSSSTTSTVAPRSVLVAALMTTFDISGQNAWHRVRVPDRIFLSNGQVAFNAMLTATYGSRLSMLTYYRRSRLLRHRGGLSYQAMANQVLLSSIRRGKYVLSASCIQGAECNYSWRVDIDQTMIVHGDISLAELRRQLSCPRCDGPIATTLSLES